MGDIFEGVPVPDDELMEFDRLALEAPRLEPGHAGRSLHNQFKLAVPRLTREIRRLREILKLEGEREQLRLERRARDLGAPRFVSKDEQSERNRRGFASGDALSFRKLLDGKKPEGVH